MVAFPGLLVPPVALDRDADHESGRGREQQHDEQTHPTPRPGRPGGPGGPGKWCGHGRKVDLRLDWKVKCRRRPLSRQRAGWTVGAGVPRAGRRSAARGPAGLRRPVWRSGPGSGGVATRRRSTLPPRLRRAPAPATAATPAVIPTAASTASSGPAQQTTQAPIAAAHSALAPPRPRWSPGLLGRPVIWPAEQVGDDPGRLRWGDHLQHDGVRGRAQGEREERAAALLPGRQVRQPARQLRSRREPQPQPTLDGIAALHKPQQLLPSGEPFRLVRRVQRAGHRHLHGTCPAPGNRRVGASCSSRCVAGAGSPRGSVLRGSAHPQPSPQGPSGGVAVSSWRAASSCPANAVRSLIRARTSAAFVVTCVRSRSCTCAHAPPSQTATSSRISSKGRPSCLARSEIEPQPGDRRLVVQAVPPEDRSAACSRPTCS